MAGTVNGFFLDPNVVDGKPRVPPTYVAARLLAGSAEQISIPTGAVYVRLKASAEMQVAFGTNPTAVTIADEDTGSSNESIGSSNPEWYYLGGTGYTKISVFGTGTVTASFYKN